MYANYTGKFKTKLNQRLLVIFKIFTLGYPTEHTHKAGQNSLDLTYQTRMHLFSTRLVFHSQILFSLTLTINKTADLSISI